MVTERYVRAADGTELYTSSVGEGLPLLLCDGLGCDGFVWRHLEPSLSPHYRVVRWHYRGHGLSQAPRDPDGLRVDHLRDDAFAVLDAWGIQRCVLLGHSMGVQVILEAALSRPERVVGLVPMCGSYGRPLETFHDSNLADVLFPRLLELTKRYSAGAQRIWSRLLSSELAFQVGVRVELNPRLIRRPDFEEYLRHLSSMDVRVFFGILEHLNRHTVEDRLHELRMPTLVVAGERDTFTPAWLSVRMAQLIPEADLLMVRSGTHAAPVELPELVNLRLERFLSERVVPRLEEPKPRRRAAKTRRKSGRASGGRSNAGTLEEAGAEVTAEG